MRIATVASHGITLRQKAGPLLTELAQRTGLTVHMAVMENNEALLIAKVEPSGTRPVATWVGKRIDYHCTSLGKALIAWMTDEEIQQPGKRASHAPSQREHYLHGGPAQERI